jgi:hypothetical protein
MVEENLSSEDIPKKKIIGCCPFIDENLVI